MANILAIPTAPPETKGPLVLLPVSPDLCQHALELERSSRKHFKVLRQQLVSRPAFWMMPFLQAVDTPGQTS